MSETPALVVGDQVIGVRDRGEVERFFSGAKEQYNKRRIMEARAEVTRFGLGDGPHRHRPGATAVVMHGEQTTH